MALTPRPPPPIATRPESAGSIDPIGTEAEALSFEVREGDTHNVFVRQGQVAAHVLTTSGLQPRVLVAFPADNVGFGLWFAETERAVKVTHDGPAVPVERGDGMHGVRVNLAFEGAASLRVVGVVGASLRALRRYAYTREVLAGMEATIFRGPPLVAERTTLDGTRLSLLVEPGAGTAVHVEHVGDDATLAITAASGTPATLRLTALTDAAPLTAIPASEIVTSGAAPEPRALQALAFLSYEEKLLAGSWRFLTYFGRDTLLSLRLLMPVLRPAVVEAALGAVVERLGPGGDVAHEEDVGEWAVWMRRRGLAPPSEDGDEGRAILDYKMVDDDFLLAPVLAHYLLDTAAGRVRAASFLGRRTTAGATYAETLRKNLDLVLRLAAPFAARREPGTLVALKEGHDVGQWRDSLEGLGRGRIPYDVNVALVPAALRAVERLYATTLFGPGAAEASGEARRLARAWIDAGRFFDVAIPRAEASERVATYARLLGAPVDEALASIDGPVRFPAIALDADGRPVPIQHSDDGFLLLFGDPDERALTGAAERIVRPFPAGLRTPVGVVVANPAFCTDAALRAIFTTAHYHGTVVWSWQQALLAAGIDRQLARTDLSPTVRSALSEAERALWDVIRTTKEASTTELWSFTIEGGAYRLVPFGQGARDADESNAAQLWSTVYLAVRPPPRLDG